MPVLDESTIADLVLDQLPSDAQAQLFLLDFERLVFRDFSRYKADPQGSPKAGDETISNAYLNIIEEMIRSETSKGEGSELIKVLRKLNAADPKSRLDLVRTRPQQSVRLIRFFPQNCFSLIAGEFFRAHLRRDGKVPGFEPLFDGRIWAGKLKGRKPGDESVYWRECGAFAWWLTRCFLKPQQGWLYVAPIIVDGTLHGVLYRYCSGQSERAAVELVKATEEAPTRFRERRYALTFEVARRIGSLEDALDAFLAGLARYENVALAIHWTQGREPTVYLRDFSEAESNLSPLAFRQLRWLPASSPHQYIDCAKSPSELDRRTNDAVVLPLPAALKCETERQKVAQSCKRVQGVLKPDLLAHFRAVGLDLRFCMGIPGHVVGLNPGEHYLELFYSELASDDVLRAKLYALVPPLAEVIRLESSARTQAEFLNRVAASLLIHEIRNALVGLCGENISRIRRHINNCLDAYRVLASPPCTKADWGKLYEELNSYHARTLDRTEIKPWPDGLRAVGVSWQLLYVVACELTRNALAQGATRITISLDPVEGAAAAAFIVASDQNVDLCALQRVIGDYWRAGFAPNVTNGLGLIIQLLRALRSPKASPVEARVSDGRLQVLCYFPIAKEETPWTT